MLCSKLIINTPKWNHGPINWETVDFEHAFAGILCTACKCMFKVSGINTTLRSLIDVVFVSLLSTLNILIRNINLANIYLFKVNNRNSTKRCEICSKLTIKIPKRRQRCCSRIFIVKFEHITHLFLVFLLLILNKQMFAWWRRLGVSFVNFEYIEHIKLMMIFC